MILMLAAAVLALPRGAVARSSEDEVAAATSYAQSVGIPVEEAARRLYMQEHAQAQVSRIVDRYSGRLAGAYWEDMPTLQFVIRLKGSAPVTPVPNVETARGELPIVIKMGAPATIDELWEKIKRHHADLYETVPGLQGIFVDERTGDIVLHVYSETLDRRDYSSRIPALRRKLDAPVRIEFLSGPMRNPLE
jgi:hypothetical protein